MAFHSNHKEPDHDTGPRSTASSKSEGRMMSSLMKRSMKKKKRKMMKKAISQTMMV